MSKDGRAHRMKVFERWRVCWDEPEYRAIVEDPELMEISDGLFGRIVPDAL